MNLLSQNAVLSSLGADFSASNVGTPRVVEVDVRRRRWRRRLVDSVRIEVDLSVSSDTDDSGLRVALLSTQLSAGIAGGDFDSYLAADSDSGVGFWGSPTTATPTYTTATSEAVGVWSDDGDGDNDDDGGGAGKDLIMGVLLTLLVLLVCGGMFFVSRIFRSDTIEQQRVSSVAPI